MLIEESIALACASLVALHALAMAVSGLSLCSRQHSAKSFHAAGVLPQPVACCACDAGMWIEFEPTWPGAVCSQHKRSNAGGASLARSL